MFPNRCSKVDDYRAVLLLGHVSKNLSGCGNVAGKRLTKTDSKSRNRSKLCTGLLRLWIYRNCTGISEFLYLPKPVSWSRAPHTPRFVENLLEITEHCKVWNCSFLVDPFRWVEAIALKLLKHRNGGSVLENSVCSEMVHDSPDAAGRGIAILVRVVAQQTFPSYPIYAQSRMHSRGCAGRHVQSDGWGLITTHCCPQFWRSKKNSNSTQFIEIYFGVSEQIKPLQPIGQAEELKFESKFEPLPTSAGHLATTPEGYLRRQTKELTAKSMAKLLGPRSGTAWAGRTGEHKHRAFPSQRQ